VGGKRQRTDRMTWLNWPNRISIARILLVAPLVICMLNLNSGWAQWRHLALALLLLLALSDVLDGSLARRLKEETPLGRFLDPIADKLLITCAVVLLALQKTSVPGFQLPSWVPVITIGKDVATILGFTLIYLVTGQFFVKPRIWGKACTTVQLVMMAYTLLAPDLPAATRPVWHLLYAAAGVLAVIAWVDYLRIGNRFAADYHAKNRMSSL
jgi:CDP-diacylglycerol--glycerol-3-phosphate 3-phosphatidyltransferase